MDRETSLLDYDASKNIYTVNTGKKFDLKLKMTREDVDNCFNFAFNMTYGGKGAHRDHRTGGKKKRKKGEIFIDTFQGKMAEWAVFRYLESKYIYATLPDMETFDLGKWDSSDLCCQDKNISIKSTKSYGNLLLLEVDDWTSEGEYLPNKEDNDGEKKAKRYDYTIMARFKPDGTKIMEENNLLYLKDNEIPSDIRGRLEKKIRDIDWFYDLPGFIFNSELVRMIKGKRIIPKGASLNGSTIMDADNYYFQIGDMHEIQDIYMLFPKEKNGHDNDLLKRKCPKCGGYLRLVEDKFKRKTGYFWGCSNYRKTGCTFRELIK